MSAADATDVDARRTRLASTCFMGPPGAAYSATTIGLDEGFGVESSYDTFRLESIIEMMGIEARYRRDESL
jgi:hypothetical protein